MLQNATTTTITKEAEKDKSYRILADRRKMTWENFLELRRNFVGGSEIASVIGCNPWASPAKTFCIKKQLIKKEPANEACYWGNVMEPILRSEFSKRTGYPVKEIPYVLQATDPRFSFLIADLDGVTTVNGQVGVIECKTANSYAAQEEWKNGEPGFIPTPYYLQIQLYLYITNLNFGYIIALLGGNHFVYHRIERDDETITGMLLLARRWYEQYFLPNIMPPPVSVSSDCSLLGQIYSKSEPKEIILDSTAGKIVQDYLDAAEAIKLAEKRKETAQAQLMALMKENETAIIAGGHHRISWKSLETKRFSTAKLKELNLLTPDQIDQCTSVTASRRFSISAIKSKAK